MTDHETRRDPLAARKRLPFAPTIRPGLAGGQGGLSALLYLLVAVALAGFVAYQLKVQQLDFSNWRVLVACGGAIYFAVRAAMMAALRRSAKNDEDDKAEKGA